MNRSSSLSVRLVASIGLIACTSLVGADEGQGCAKYSAHGLSPGMTNRLVWLAMDGKGDDQSSLRGPFGQHSTARYDRNPGTVYIEYDRAIDKRSDARVVSIETSFPEDTLDLAEFTQSLVDALGPPTTGAENLENALRQGPAQWVDEACDIQVTASRRLPEWWQPSKKASIHVQVQSLTFVRTGSFPEKVDATRTADASFANPFDLSASEEPSSLPSENRQMTVNDTPPPVETASLSGDTVRSLSSATIPSTAKQTSTQPRMASLSLGPAEQPASDAVTSPAPPEATGSPTDPDAEVDGVDPAAETAPYVAGVGGVTEPERLPRYSFQPQLPAAAKLQKIKGQVVLQALVLKDGTVGDVELLHVSDPGLGLEQSAIRAVKKWRYRPARLYGRPVDALVNVFVTFE